MDSEEQCSGRRMFNPPPSRCVCCELQTGSRGGITVAWGIQAFQIFDQVGFEDRECRVKV